MKTRLIINVRNGNIEHIISNNPDVEIQIFDHDNAAVQMLDSVIDDFNKKFEPDEIMTNTEMNKYTKTSLHEYGVDNPVIGFQLMMCDKLHPKIKNNNSVYSFGQITDMQINTRLFTNPDFFKVVEIRKNDIENPEMMFEGDIYS
ncbi:MAG: hypothetical protein ACOCVF_04010 [bacterium]